MAIIESPTYNLEAEELSRRVEVEAAAADLILNEVDLDLKSHAGMLAVRDVLARNGIHSSYIGGGARAVDIAMSRFLSEGRLIPRDENVAHSLAVNIFVRQPEVKAIQPLYENILEILKSLYAENESLATPLKSLQTVIDFHARVYDAETNK